MATQKRARSASARAKSGGTATGRADTAARSGSADSKRSAGRATQDGGQAGGQRQGGRGQAGRGGRQDATRAQNGRADRGRAPGGGRGPGGRGPGNRGPGNRGQNSPQARAGAAAAGLSAAQAAPRPAPPRWFQLTTLGLSLAALGVSIYLTIVHYTSPRLLACSANGTINCEKVISSSQSMVFGVFPVAVLGLAFYVFMVGINTPWAWRSPLPVIWWARLGGIVAGIGFVLYLLYAELIQIGNICLWCTSVHVITFLLFVLLIFYATLGSGATASTRLETTAAR
jgi:uncharacterized membrane protein